jgi:hypothetical protein
MSDYELMAGKVIERVEHNEGRDTYGDDQGFTIYFTDGTSYSVSASMGQGAGYIIEGFDER